MCDPLAPQDRESARAQLGCERAFDDRRQPDVAFGARDQTHASRLRAERHVMDLQVGIEQVVLGFRRRQRDIATMMPRSMGFPSWGFAAATLCLSVFSRRSF